MFVVMSVVKDDKTVVLNFKSRKVALETRDQLRKAGHEAKATIVKELD